MCGYTYRVAADNFTNDRYLESQIVTVVFLNAFRIHQFANVDFVFCQKYNNTFNLNKSSLGLNKQIKTPFWRSNNNTWRYSDVILTVNKRELFLIADDVYLFLFHLHEINCKYIYWSICFSSTSIWVFTVIFIRQSIIDGKCHYCFIIWLLSMVIMIFRVSFIWFIHRRSRY